MNPRLMSKRALAKFTLSIPKHKRHLAERHLEWAQKQHDSTGGKNKPVLEYDDDEAEELGEALWAFWMRLWLTSDPWGRGPADTIELETILLRTNEEMTKDGLEGGIQAAITTLSDTGYLHLYDVDGCGYWELVDYADVPQEMLAGRRWGLVPGPDGVVPRISGEL